MRLIVVGASKVGIDFVKWFCNEGCDVVIVDEDEDKISEITDKYDCNGFVGNGSSRAFLKTLGIDATSMLIAVTKSDESNILCCHIAKQLGVKEALASIRGPEYKEDVDFLKNEMGVDMILNPDRSAAKVLAKLIKYASAIEIEEFKNIEMTLVSIKVTPDSKLIGLNGENIFRIWADIVKICFVERNGKILKFDETYTATVGDKLFISTVKSNLERVLQQIDIKEKSGKTVIVGGGKIGYFLLKYMSESEKNVTLVEKDLKRCKELMEEFPTANIIIGDGTKADFIGKCLQDADACIAVTGSDDKNLVISMFAKSFGIERIAAEIQSDDYEIVMKKSGIAHVFSKQDVEVSSIIKETRILSSGLDVDSPDSIQWMNILELNKIEAYEFMIGRDFPLCDTPIGSKSFKIKKGVSIAGIYRDEVSFVPKKSDGVRVGDKIVVVTANLKINKLSDILA